MDLYDDIYEVGAQSPDTTIENRELDSTHQDNGSTCGDLDLYDDLLTEEGQQQMDSYKELCEKFEAAISKINILENENKQLREETKKFDETQRNVQKNISSLLVTARSELSRKEREIQNLRHKLGSPIYRRGVYNGFRNVDKAATKSTSESFTSVDSNFEPMLVSSPLDDPKERKKRLPGTNNRKSPGTKDMKMTFKPENKLAGLSSDKTKSKNVKSASIVRHSSNGHISYIELDIQDKVSNIKDRHSRTKDENISKHVSKQNNDGDKRSNLNDRFSPKRTKTKTASSNIKKDSDSSQDSSPERQNSSRTLFSHRAMKKLEVATKSSNVNKSSSLDRKSTTCIIKSNHKDEIGSEKLSRIEADMASIKKEEQHKNGAVMMKSNEGKTSEKVRKDPVEEKEVRSKYEPKKVFDLREKLKLKRHLKEQTKGGKTTDFEIKNSAKRKLNEDETSYMIKRKKHENDSDRSGLKVSVQVDTTAIDEDFCQDDNKKRTTSATSLSCPREVMTDVSNSKCQPVDDFLRKNIEFRDVVSYSQSDSLNRDASLTSKLHETFEKENKTKAEIDRLKQLMERTATSISDSQSLEEHNDNQTVVDQSSSQIADRTDTQDISHSESNIVCDGFTNTNVSNTNNFRHKSDNVNPENVGNISEHSDISILYANIGDETLETSGRSNVSDNFDVEIFRPPVRDKDNVSSSSPPHFTDKKPKNLANGEKEVSASNEITPTVREQNSLIKKLDNIEVTELSYDHERVKESEKQSSGSITETFPHIEGNITTNFGFELVKNKNSKDQDRQSVSSTALQSDKTLEICHKSIMIEEKESENAKSMMEKCQLQEMNDSGSDELLIDKEDIFILKKTKRRKHKKDRKRRKSKCSNNSHSTDSSIDDSKNDVCDRLITEYDKESSDGPVKMPPFQESPSKSKFSNLEKQCDILPRTPKSEKKSPSIYRGVISETVSIKTSNVIDRSEGFLLPARPPKSKQRSVAEVQLEKSPTKGGQSDVSKCDLERISKSVARENNAETLMDSKIVSDKRNDTSKEEAVTSSSSGTSEGSYGSFGSNILSETTSSLSIDTAADKSFTSNSSMSSNVTTSDSATSSSGTFEDSTESQEIELTEKENDYKRLDNDIIGLNKQEFSKAAGKLEADINDQLTCNTIDMESSFMNVVSCKEKTKSAVTENGKPNCNNAEIDLEFSQNSGLKPNADKMDSAVIDVTNLDANHEKDINKNTCKDVELPLIIQEENQDNDMQKGKRKRHHTDGCLISIDVGCKANSYADRVGSLDRSLLLQCLLNEVSFIVDNTKNEEKLQKRKYKTGTYKKRATNCKESIRSAMHDAELKTEKQQTSSSVSVNEEVSFKNVVLCEMNTPDVPNLEVSKSDSKTVINKPSLANEENSYNDRRCTGLLPEEIVFGSWTGLSVTQSKSDITQNFTSESRIYADENTTECIEQSLEGNSAIQNKKEKESIPNSNVIDKKNTTLDHNTIAQASNQLKTITSNSPIQTKNYPNCYFEIDEQPKYLDAAGTDNSSKLPKTADIDRKDASKNSEATVTCDFSNYCKKSSHKVRMIKRQSPLKLKSEFKTDLLRMNQSPGNKNCKDLLTGYVSSPEKKSTVPLKSVSADSVLSSILNRNISGEHQGSIPLSRELKLNKKATEQVIELPTSSANEIKGLSKDFVQSKRNAENKNKLDIITQNGNLKKLSSDEKDTGTDGLTDKSIACFQVQRHQLKAIKIKDQKELPDERDSKHKRRKSEPKTVAKLIHSRESERNRKPLDLSAKTANEKGQNLADVDKMFGSKTSVANECNVINKEQLSNIIDKIHLEKAKCPAGLAASSPTEDLNCMNKEKVITGVTLRRSPRKKCSILNSKTELEHKNKDGNFKENNFQKQNAKIITESVKEEKITSGLQNSVKSKQNFPCRSVTDLLKTPCKEVPDSGSKFDESESPAKNTRSATKMHAKWMASASANISLESDRGQSAKKKKEQSSFKKSLTFSKKLTKDKIKANETKQKTSSNKNKSVVHIVVSDDIFQLENVEPRQKLEVEMAQEIGTSLCKSRTYPFVARELENVKKTSDSMNGPESLDLTSKEVNARKSRGYTDLHSRTCKASAFSNFKSKSDNSKKLHISQRSNTVLSNNPQRSEYPKDSIKSSKVNTIENQPIINASVNESDILEKQVNNAKGKSKTKESNANESVHVDERNVMPKDRKRNAEMIRNYRIPKRKAEQLKGNENFLSSLKLSDQKVNDVSIENKKTLLGSATSRRNSSVNSDAQNFPTKSKILSDTFENNYSKTTKVKLSESKEIVDIISKNKELHESLGEQFTWKVSECDRLAEYDFLEKKSKRCATRKKPGQYNEIIQKKTEKQSQPRESDFHKRKTEMHINPAVTSYEPCRTSRKEKSDNVNNLQTMSKESLVRNSKQFTPNIDFEPGPGEESFLNKHKFEKTKERIDTSFKLKTLRKGTLDQSKHKVSDSPHKSYNGKQNVKSKNVEMYANEFEEMYRSLDSDYDNDSVGSDATAIPDRSLFGSDSDLDSVQTDRTDLLNKSLFGSDSSDDDNTDNYHLESPAKMAIWRKEKSCNAATKHTAIDYPERNGQHGIKEHTNKHDEHHSLEEKDKERTFSINKTNSESMVTDSQAVSKNYQNHVDEQIQCSLSGSCETKHKGHKVKHGNFDCSSDGIQSFSTSATSASGTLLLDFEDTLDHTDYVDSFLHERSFMSNTSKSDQSFHEHSSQINCEPSNVLNESLEDGEVMSSDNEAFINLPVGSSRTQAHKTKSYTKPEKESGQKGFSPIKFPEHLPTNKTNKNVSIGKSVKLCEVRKEFAHDSKLGECLGVRNDTLLNRDVFERCSKDNGRRRERSCSNSPRRQINSNVGSHRLHQKTPKNKSGASPDQKRHSASRSPRPNRRSRSHSPRSRNRHRSYSRSPRRRYPRSRTRSGSRERRVYSRHRHRSPGPRHRHRSPEYYKTVDKGGSRKRRTPSPVTPHRSRHRNTSPHLFHRSRPRRSKSRSPSCSPCHHSKSRRKQSHSPHHHRHSACKPSSCNKRQCCVSEEHKNCTLKICKHMSKLESKRLEPRSRHSPERPSRHSHRHRESSFKKRKRSCSLSDSGRSRSRSKDRHFYKPKRQRANLSQHYDCSSDENEDTDIERSHHEHKY